MMEVDARCRLVALFCFILCLHSLALFFFTSGFLLSRTELPEFSTCSDVAKSPCFGESMGFSDAVTSENVLRNCDHVVEDKAFCVQNETIWEPVGGGGSDDKLNKECWTKPAIKRAIILIIDALRFDFVAPSSSFAGESLPWMDKLQVLQQLSKEENGSARIFKFVADPPTTTLQRLKGLTTGGLPTFVDVGHSFGAPAIVEDNIIHQLVRAGKKVRMMGDDTWMKLFPSYFSVAHPFDSFNVKDLHTVDDGVIREIFPALLESDWNVLIGHLLGVDHVGHIFGVESPLMVEKLEQYNQFIEEIVAVLKNQSGPGGLHEDTMLLVLGDHGQTLNGDHGGGTAEEVETALFALSMRESPGRLPLDLQSSTCITSTEVKADQNQCITTFPQLDFASTMAALLGVPFPFGSVGRVNTELYALAASTWPLPSEVGHHPEALVRVWLERYNHVLCMNRWQVKRYLDAYTASSIRGFPSADFAHVQSLYEKAQIIPHSLCIDHPYSKRNDSESDFSKYSSELETRLIDSIQGNLVYLLAAATLARTQWTQFADEWMAIGLTLLITSVVIHAVAFSRAMRITHRVLPSEDKDSEMWNRLHELFPFRRMLLACGGAAVTAGVIWGLQLTARWMKSSPVAASTRGQTNIINAALIFIAPIIAYAMPVYGFVQVRSDQSILEKGPTIGTSSRYPWAYAKSYMAVLFVGLHACGLLSNSYILSEGQVVCFLLATSGILYLRQAIQSGCKVPQAILFLILNAGMASVGLFEIFKDPVTVASSPPKDDYVSASYSPQKLITLACIALATTVLPLFSLAWLILRRARTIFTFKSLYWATAVTVPLAYFLLVIHWFAMDLVSSMVVEIPESFKEFSRLLCPQLVYLASLMLLVFTVTVMALNARGNVSTSGRDHLVEGIVSMLAGISGTIILLLGRKGPTIILLAVLEVWCLLDLQGVENLSQDSKQADKELVHQDEHSNGRTLGSYFAAAVDWNLVAVQLFFCTGHRCTFDGLHYTAAFIGFDEFYFYRQGALLAADTFGSSHILPVVGLPLLVTAAAVGTSPRSKPSTSDATFFSLEVAKMYLCYGLVRTILTAVTTFCVTLQRRHLMVWGLFAPKYVFDALGLLVTDGCIVIAAIAYFSFFSRKMRLKMQ